MVDKVVDFGKKILTRVQEWWSKFKPKQKTLIIGVLVVILLAIAILVAVLSRKQYVNLVTCDSTKEAAEIRDLLDGEGLDYKVSSDGLEFEILSTQTSDANLLLGANNIPTAAYTMEDVLDGSFSTTEADKQKKYKLYLETQLETDIASLNAIKTASVELTIPDDNGTLISQNQESYAGILIDINDGASFTEDNAAAIARLVATGLGNDTTDNITITDVDGNIWFPVEKSYSTVEDASTMMMLKQEAESLIKSEVRQVLFGTNEFNQIEVATNVSMDFSQKETTKHSYSAPDGHDQGMLSHEEVYQSTATDDVGGVPGTDSNTETDTYISDSTGTNSSSYEKISDYLPDETIEKSTDATGTIVYADSSVSVAAVKYKIVREEDVRLQGLLEGITWDEYKLANDERTKLEVDSDLVSMVANATGIPSKNITFVAYEEIQFIDEVETSVDYKNIMQIVLIVIILALLAFVVILSLRTKKEVEEEEELAVEDLLESTQVEQLESIESEQKSEARKLIENFVEENPEAVATLLRNWLDEDWG
jgi:flagellar M-ring protein FliF